MRFTVLLSSLQSVAGVSPAVHWISYLAWDTLTFQIPACMLNMLRVADPLDCTSSPGAQ